MLHRNQRFGLTVRIIAATIAGLWLLSNLVMVVVAGTAGPNNEMLGAKQDLSFVEEIEQPEQITQPINEPILFQELSYKTLYDKQQCQEFINLLYSNIEQLDLAMESDKYTVDATDLMLLEKARLLDIIYYVESDIKHYTVWEAEYYYATKTWQFLKQQGYSDVVVSGIIGNMMVETGGQTLKLSPTLYDAATGRYYGLCQWSLYYRPSVADMPFEEQLTYLTSDIEYEFNVFGSRYRPGFTYNDFLSLTDPCSAALAFAKAYERCASWTYDIRQTAARKAYEYFDLNKPI